MLEYTLFEVNLDPFESYSQKALVFVERKYIVVFVLLRGLQRKLCIKAFGIC